MRKKEPKTYQLPIRVNKEMAEWVTAQADQSGISKNSLVNMILKWFKDKGMAIVSRQS